MEWSFSIIHLVKLFRKLKLTKNYHYYVYVPPNAGLYYLVVMDSIKSRVIATFQHNWMVVVTNPTEKEQFLYLGTKLLDVVCAMGVAEATTTNVLLSTAFSDNGTQESVFIRIGETLDISKGEILASQEALLPSEKLLIQSHMLVEDAVDENPDIKYLTELPVMLEAIKSCPYDITRMVFKDKFAYFVNDPQTRLLRAPVAEVLPDIDILNTFEMHNVLSGLFIYDVRYVPEFHAVYFDYGMSKTDNHLATARFYFNTQPSIPATFTEAYDSFAPTHKTKVSNHYLKALKSIYDANPSEDTIGFLTFNTATKLYARDLSWLLGYKRDVDIAYQSQNSACRFDTVSGVEALFTLYAQME